MSPSSPKGPTVSGEPRSPRNHEGAGSNQPEPMSHFQNTFECNTHSGKRFKACRTCRKHKLKCERKNDGTCQRCHDNGVRCVYDAIGSRRRDGVSKGHGKNQRNYATQASPGLGSPNGHVQPNNEQTITVDTGLPSSPFPSHSNGLLPGPVPSVGASPDEANAGINHTPTSQPSELTSQDLRAPVSAMHNMGQYEEAHHPSKTPTSTAYNSDQTSFQRRGLLFGRDAKQNDMVTKGIINQRQARQLFNTFIASATSFLPIFDPILDSFETLRSREPFCFSVILALACCMDGSLLLEQCRAEVKDLVTATLFDYSASLGKVQGMILLAAYAENTWFAIGHALQMAQDLKLDQTLSQQQTPNQPGTMGNIESQRQAIRSARVWLALCFIEREIAIGTARLSRIPEVPANELAYFTYQSQTHPPNMRLASLVEAVQIRDEFLAEITLAQDLEHNGLRQLRLMETKFEEWLQNWDAQHKDCGYDISSFQRTSLHGQKRYAMIFLGCATIGKVIGGRPLSLAVKDSSGALSEITSFIMSIAMDQLRRVMESESYKWHLRWATNYTVLSLTFTCIFALEISRHRDDLNAREVFDMVAGIAQILAEYHDPFFHQLLQIRLSHHPGASSDMLPDPTQLGTSQEQLGLNQSSNTISAHPDSGSSHLPSVQFQLPMDPTREILTPDMGFDGVYRQNTLNQLLETPDWMMNPSSMLVMDLDDWQSNDVLGNNS